MYCYCPYLIDVIGSPILYCSRRAYRRAQAQQLIFPIFRDFYNQVRGSVENWYLGNKIILSATSDHLTKASLAEQVTRSQVCIWHLLKPAMKCFVSMSTLLIAVLGCYCQKDNLQALSLIPASEKLNLNLIEWILVAGRARREKLGKDCLPSQKCPAKNTCCYVSSTKFRCCPLKDAVCCADHTCCPGGYRCTETICKKKKTINITQHLSVT
ncbi:hypothetical protein ABFA07_002122 [Porites harrisoni]